MSNILIVKYYPVMISHLNSLYYFSLRIESLRPNLFRFGWDFTDSDNFEGQRSNVLKYPSDYLIQPQGNLFTMNSIEIIDAKREIG